MSKLPFLFLFVWILATPKLEAQVLENYEGKWQSAREESWFGTNNQVELELDLISFPRALVQIHLPSQSTVFIDEKLWQLTLTDTLIYQSVAELRSEFGKDSVTFTVVNPNLGSGYPVVKKVLGRNEPNDAIPPAGELATNERFVSQPVKDFYVTAFLLTLFFLSLYKLAYPYLLAVMVQPLAVISAEDFSESGNLQKFFSFDILFYLLIVGMMISELAVLSLVVFKKDWLETWIGIDYSSLTLTWFLGVLGILFLMILKFIGIRLIAYLFDLGKAEFSHFFYLLRLIVFGCSILLLIGGYFVVNDYMGLESAFTILIPGFFWGYIFGMLGLFLIMMNRLDFKKYHLFTYLCIAELIPFLILTKWILYLGQ
ncbi:DUF4271 domain-containing protein [Algoriphagus litoralis]|uniref:DUF4271 domain-containing protein n=1 Tax=Algoriphagus litoralis TaxID=2202829 RepID=UPI000DB9758D|nr:DUF4271 domain-containing protein [Algoriphagus litoralis]